jgi:hypothetical protein
MIETIEPWMLAVGGTILLAGMFRLLANRTQTAADLADEQRFLFGGNQYVADGPFSGTDDEGFPIRRALDVETGTRVWFRAHDQVLIQHLVLVREGNLTERKYVAAGSLSEATKLAAAGLRELSGVAVVAVQDGFITTQGYLPHP